MKVKNANIEDNQLRVFLPHSKMDRYGKGHWIYLNQCPLRNICPIWLLRQSLMVRPEFNDNLFVHDDGSLHLSHDQLTSHANFIKKLGRWRSDSFKLYIRPNSFV